MSRIQILARAPALALALFVLSPTARSQVFSVSPGGGSGLPADTLFLPGPTPVLVGVGANVDAIALGRPAAIFSFFHVLEFSVSPLSTGLPGTAVLAEAIGGLGGPGDHPADIFSDFVAGSNVQVLDGDGIPNPTPGFAFGLIEPFPTPGDNVDGWDNQPAPPFSAVWFSVDPALSPGLISPADIYFSPVVAGYDAAPPAILYASGVALGLDLSGLGTDDIDALVYFEDLTMGFTPGDIILFSLAPGSAAFTNGSPYTGFGAADIFMVSGAGPGIYRSAAAMGLATTDNVDALDINASTFVIPEPASVGLFLAGFTAFGLIRSRRRAKRMFNG